MQFDFSCIKAAYQHFLVYLTRLTNICMFYQLVVCKSTGNLLTVLDQRGLIVQDYYN